MNNKEFLFLLDAILMNAIDQPGRQAWLLCQALRRGHIGGSATIELCKKHEIARSFDDLAKRCAAYPWSTPAPDPDDQLDHQQIPEPPAEFEQDPMNPCGATDPRF